MLKSSINFLLILTIFSAYAYAAPEDICPGGSSPDANVIECNNFESTTGCTTGSENDCFTGNNPNADTSTKGQWAIVTSSEALEGNRYARALSQKGSNTLGFFENTLGLSNRTTANFRFYVRFDGGWMTYYNNHNFGLTMTTDDGTTCIRGGTLELNQWSSFLYSSASVGCSQGGFDLHPNIASAPILTNGDWHQINILYKMDTSCSDVGSLHGCNGIYKLWIDGTLITEYTDINYGGYTQGVKIRSYQAPRTYFHGRFAFDNQELGFDAIVVSNSTSYIPSATGAVPGTAVSGSPYIAPCGIEANWHSQSNPYNGTAPINGDCAEFLCNSHNYPQNDTAKAGVVTFDDSSTFNAGGVANGCPGVTDGALKTVAAADKRVGVVFDRYGGTASWSSGNTSFGRNIVFPTLSITDVMYLPSSNNYTGGKIAFNGWRQYANSDADAGSYLAVSVKNGHWSVIERADTNYTEHESAVTADHDVKNLVELMAFKNDGVTEEFTLRVNGVKIFDREDTVRDFGWMFGGAGNSTDNGAVVGIIDNQTGTSITAYHDNYRVGSPSFESTDGWGSDSPFEIESGGATGTGLNLSVVRGIRSKR